MRKRLLGVFAAAGLTLTAAAGQAFAGASWTPVDCVASPGALQPAINAASAGAVLEITGTCTDNFVVDKNLTLIGKNGARLEGLLFSGFPTLAVNPGITATVKRLTITGGDDSGILNEGTLTVVRSHIDDNGASGGGGGILNEDGGTVTLKFSSVDGNTQGGPGGGIFTSGGVVTLVGSSVSGNTANPGSGGGIANSGGTVTLKYSRVYGNTVFAGNGGGIENVGVSTLTLLGSYVNSNATDGGGCINNDGGTLKVIASGISRNVAVLGGGGILSASETSTVTAIASRVGHNDGRAGGGIRNNDGALAVIASCLIGNEAVIGGGGAVLNDFGTLTIKASVLKRNSANFGGGIENNGEGDQGTAAIIKTVVLGNTANVGGGIEVFGGSVTLNKTLVLKNTANTEGAGVFNDAGEGGTVTLNKSTVFLNNPNNCAGVAATGCL